MNHPQWMMEKMGFKDISQATEKQLHMATQWAGGNAKMYRDKIQKAALNGRLRLRHQAKIHKCRLMKQLQELFAI